MKNGIIAGSIILAGIGGSVAILNNDNNTKTEVGYHKYTDKDCADFSSQREAQTFFEAEGGPASDYHRLDRDGDGRVCESLK